jgi:hypothetical protein
MAEWSQDHVVDICLFKFKLGTCVRFLDKLEIGHGP